MTIEQIIRDYLLAKLNNVPVEVTEPTNALEKYITFRVIDQGIENYIQAVTVEFYSYGNSPLESSLLNEELKKAMLDIVELDEIFSCKLGGGGSDFKNDMKRFRYRSYFNIFY